METFLFAGYSVTYLICISSYAFLKFKFSFFNLSIAIFNNNFLKEIFIKINVYLLEL